MLIGFAVFVIVSTIVLIIGGRFWRSRTLPRKRGTVYAAIAVLMLAGLLIMIVGAARIRVDVEIRSWPTVSGYVVSSDVAGKRAMHPNVTYRYTVDGREFKGVSDLDMPGFGNRRSRLETAEIIVHEYPPGTIVTVHYNPDNPADSTLRYTLEYGPTIQIMFGFLLYLGGVFMLPWRFRLRHRQPR
jgi:hypothetical protein